VILSTQSRTAAYLHGIYQVKRANMKAN